MSDPLNIKICDTHVEIEGIRFSWFFLSETFRNVPRGIFSFHRDGENLVVTRHDTPESCLKYLTESKI